MTIVDTAVKHYIIWHWSFMVVFAPAPEILYAVVESVAGRASRVWLPQSFPGILKPPVTGETARVWARLRSR